MNINVEKIITKNKNETKTMVFIFIFYFILFYFLLFFFFFTFLLSSLCLFPRIFFILDIYRLKIYYKLQPNYKIQEDTNFCLASIIRRPLLMKISEGDKNLGRHYFGR